MLSNHNTTLVKELYKDFNIHVIEAKRNINANGKKRGKVEEVIITNYENKRGFELSYLELEQTLNTWNRSINSRIFHSGVNERVRRISFTRFIGTRVCSIIGSSYDNTNMKFLLSQFQ